MRPDGVCALLFLCGGCVGHAQDAHEPGDRLGTYHASSALTSDTCQAAVLAASADWQFDVKLSRQESTLYWLNGQEAIPGTIAKNGTTFHFESGVEVTLQAAQGARVGCVIERTDSATGELSSKGSDVLTFTADMRFGYAVKAGSQCSGFIGVEDGFASLPCQVDYSLTARRTSLPPSLD